MLCPLYQHSFAPLHLRSVNSFARITDLKQLEQISATLPRAAGMSVHPFRPLAGERLACHSDHEQDEGSVRDLRSLCKVMNVTLTQTEQNPVARRGVAACTRTLDVGAHPA